MRRTILLIGGFTVLSPPSICSCWCKLKWLASNGNPLLIDLNYLENHLRFTNMSISQMRLERRFNLLIEGFTCTRREQVIVAWCNKWLASNGNPLGPCTWIISRTIWDRTNMWISNVRLDERNNLLIECFTVTRHQFQVIVADVTWNGWRVNGNPLGPCTWIISRTIWDRTNMSIAKMCASMRRTIY